MTHERQPLLFHRDAPKPTTREVARLVKAGGVSALPSPTTRADHATYQEIQCRSALNRAIGTPFRWTLNPYRGCTHGCHYCFARRYQTQLELNAGDDFASVIFVKTNFVEVLRRELQKPTWEKEFVALGTATDPYQPIEGSYRLSRGTLEALAESATPVGLVTKGPMVVRDCDLLQELSRRAACTVYMSVPTVDEDAWATLEPGTAHPLQRLRAVKALVDAGVRTSVLMAPLVPGFSTAPAKIERTLRAIRDSGAHGVSGMVMHLDGGTRDHFMSFLSNAYPDLVERYERLYAAKHARPEYLARVEDAVQGLKARYGFSVGYRRGENSDKDPVGSVAAVTRKRRPAQATFRWGRAGRRGRQPIAT